MFSNQKRILIFTVILSTFAFAARSAFSAEPTPKTEATMQLGVAFPMVGDLEDIADTGLSFGAQVMSQANARSMYGIEVGYITFGEDSEQQVDTEVSIISTLMKARHALAAKGNRAPFFETGLGFARTQVNINSPGSSGPAIVQGSNEEDISPTFMLGVGFDLPVSDGATFGMSLNYQHFFFKVGDVDGGGSLGLLAHLRI